MARSGVPVWVALILWSMTLNPANAETNPTSSASNGGSSGFVQVINQVGQQGLNLLRAILFVFLMIYAVFLGVAVAFGQAGSQEITSFIIGTIFIAGAQLIAAIYLAILN
jgi:hypothetical protein